MFINYCFKNLVPSVNNVISVVKKKSQSQGAIFKDWTNASLSRFFEVTVAYGIEPAILRSCAIIFPRSNNRKVIGQPRKDYANIV